MTSNQTGKVAISNDLRTKVIQKFQMLHTQLQTATPPEQLEKSCFDKANNDQELYIKLCNNLVSNRKNQLENNAQRNIVVNNQVRGVMNPNFRPNIVTQNNNGTVSDPLNALQNLAVTAGQVNQMNIQQANPQIAYRMNQPNIIQMNPNSQIHPRMVITGNRPLDQFSIQQQQHMTQSPSPQMMPSQIQLHTMNTMNVANNGASIRLINKNGAMKPETNISQNQTMQPATYPMDSNTGQINNQHINNVMHTPIVRQPVNRIVPSSPMAITLAQHQSPQDHYTIPNNQVPQNITVIPSNSSVQSEEMIHQPSVSLSNVSTPQSTPAPAPAPPRAEISEEETIKVKEELAKLSVKYFRYLKLALETPLNIPNETIKIWMVLKGLLDTSKPCDKPISLKHVAKIQVYSEKAAQHVIQNNLDPKRSPVKSNDEFFGKRSIPDRNKTPYIPETFDCGMDLLGSTNHTNSLEFAFKDVMQKIEKQKDEHKKSAQRGIRNFIRRNRRDCLHFMPKHMQTDSDHSDSKEMDVEFDEHEFDHINEESEDIKFTNTAFDKNGFLRVDRNLNYCNTHAVDVRKEIELMQKEFDVMQIESQIKSLEWSSGDSEWDNSTFYSIRMKNRDFPSEIPSILVRIPEDYEQSSSSDWNLNLHLYKSNVSIEANIFLTDVKIALEEEFSNILSQPWIGLPLLDIISIYKRSIFTGLSNYQCRQSM